MFCASCGKPVLDTDHFCGHCGAHRLEEPAGMASPTAPSVPRAAEGVPTRPTLPGMTPPVVAPNSLPTADARPAPPARKGRGPTLLVVIGAMVVFTAIGALTGHSDEPSIPVIPDQTEPAPSPSPARAGNPLAPSPGAVAQDDDLLKVDWASHRGIFPFSGVDRIESVQELDQLTRLIDEKVSDGTLSLDDEPAEDGLLYGTLFKVNRGRMDRMAEEFKALAEREQLSSYDLACEVVRCIQKVPYVIPDQVTSDHPLGIFTPNEVAHYDGGDCDTKSLMAAILLSRLGYHCVLFGSDYYRHAMLGVEVPGSDGYYADYEGHRYWWVEMTAYDAPIGGRPSECLDDSKWVITPLE